MTRPAAALFWALAVLAPAPAAAQYMEPAFGRLFTTPEERLNLDRARAGAAPAGMAQPAPAGTLQPAPAAAPRAADPAPVADVAPPPAPVRFTGVIRRSDGRATVFIDDEPQETTLGRYRAGSPIPVDTPAGRVLAKPGQSIDPTDGTPRDPR